jgi:hypothetical protein
MSTTRFADHQSFPLMAVYNECNRSKYFFKGVFLEKKSIN